MWGIVHNLVRPAAPGAIEAECSCGWRGNPAQYPEHLAAVTKGARDRIADFVDFVDEEIRNGASLWGDIDKDPTMGGFMTPAAFVNAMRNLGFKRLSR